jgi:signal transduction histidine kinase
MREFTFSVDGALLSELGEKLVESPHIALVELVKNAYDADATQVAIRIHPDAKHGPEVHVVDNGSGMSSRDVERYWMRIATTHKVNDEVSQRFGRPRTGSKGIGRFSCRRLGTQLVLRTNAAVGDGFFERTEVEFDWLRFKPGREIKEVVCRGTTTRVKQAASGTTLIMRKSPVDEWSKRGYDFLKRQLAVLAASRGRKRAGFDEDPGFNVSLEAPDFNDKIIDLRDRLLSAGWGTLKARVSHNGEATCTLNALRIGEKTVTYPERVPELAGVTATIGIMPVDRVELRERDVISLGSLSEILEEWGGVFIRYRGFRVYPFGEPGNDWLNIDRDRGARKTALPEVLHPFAAKLRGVNPHRAMLGLLSSTSYIGDVEIGKGAKGFELKASREGFVGEAGIGRLRELIRFAIDWSTMYREYSKSLYHKEQAYRARTDLEKQLKNPVDPATVVASAIGVVESEVRNLATQLPTSQRQQLLRSIRTATEAIEKHEASSRAELRHLQLVASTSTLLLIFSHEVKSLLSWLEQASISLEAVRRRVDSTEARRLGEIRDELATTKDRFIELLSMTSLISVKDSKSEPVHLALRSRLERAVRCFSLISRSYEVEIDVNRVAPSLQVGPMLEAELFAVLLNVISNAIKSVIAAGGQKRIMLAAERQGAQITLSVRDSGIGLDEAHYERVFSPFVSDPENRLYIGLDAKLNPEDEYIVGTGSGLGLSIVREILAFRGGRINFVKPSDGWRAELEISLP